MKPVNFEDLSPYNALSIETAKGNIEAGTLGLFRAVSSRSTAQAIVLPARREHTATLYVAGSLINLICSGKQKFSGENTGGLLEISSSAIRNSSSDRFI
jgi:hypothetical protein